MTPDSQRGVTLLLTCEYRDDALRIAGPRPPGSTGFPGSMVPAHRLSTG
jgi:hypothetical protein